MFLDENRVFAVGDQYVALMTHPLHFIFFKKKLEEL